MTTTTTARGSGCDRKDFSEALVYYDDEALYFEVRGQDSGIVRISFEMLETLKTVIEEEEDSNK